jgi:AcrR family transcriptional regulator
MSQTRPYVVADERRAQILKAAIKVARRRGLSNVSMAEVAAAAGCSRPRVAQLLGNVKKFRRALVDEAIRVEDLKLIGQGLTMQDRNCMKLSEDVKRRALAAAAAA